MKKKYVFSMILFFIIINIVGCSHKDKNNLPTASVSLRHSQMDSNIHIFDWYVKNVSDNEEKTLTFKNGKITNYEIKNLQSNKKYTNNNSEIKNFELINKKNNNTEDNCTVILNSGEKYHKTIVIQSLEKGKYTVKFWSVSEEGTNPAMTIDFEVEATE